MTEIRLLGERRYRIALTQDVPKRGRVVWAHHLRASDGKPWGGREFPLDDWRALTMGTEAGEQLALPCVTEEEPAHATP